MPDWDEDSPRLRSNLIALLRQLRDHGRARRPLGAADLRTWHRSMMEGLTPPRPEWVGVFRGESGAGGVEVRVGPFPGVSAATVAHEVHRFFGTLESLLTHLDAQVPANADELTTDHLEAILEACAWAHAEWVRLHPFTNGNGRTARLLANYLAMRYGLPPFVRLRPRPDAGYGSAAVKAMTGDWQAAIPVFRAFLAEVNGP